MPRMSIIKKAPAAMVISVLGAWCLPLMLRDLVLRDLVAAARSRNAALSSDTALGLVQFWIERGDLSGASRGKLSMAVVRVSVQMVRSTMAQESEIIDVAFDSFKNEQGFITTERLKEAFDKFDTSGDGFISVTELKGLMESLGGDFTEEDIFEMLEVADKDKDGKVSFDEYKNIMSGY